MRYLTILLALLSSVLAAEPQYPLWDGAESVADYAKRVNLPPMQTLDLGNGVTMELVLIPAGKFIMGTPEPAPVDEAAFHAKIVTEQALFAVSAIVLLAILIVVIVRAVRKKRRPQLSLSLLLLVTVAAGGCVLSGLHWRHSAKEFEQARAKYATAKAWSDAATPNEKPAHSVTLTKPYYMGKFEVMQEQYQQIMGRNPSEFKGLDHPVENESWDEANQFCTRLSTHSGQEIRLPTEAEWEYACRAGSTSAYYSGNSDADLLRVAWCDINSNDSTRPVGKKEANAFGLYDMHGNAWEQCADWLDESYYSKSPDRDPKGPEKGRVHVLRGGSQNFDPIECRSAFRGGVDHPAYSIGFRVTMTARVSTQ